MPQAEAERRTQPAVDGAVVERRAAGRSGRLTEPSVGHERHMHQRQHPAQQQRHGQHDEQIAHVDTRRIGREEDRQERKDGDQRRAQQRHRRLPADGRHRLAARFPEFQVDQDAVHDHDGIVDQHSHGQDERRQRHALHRSVGHPQNQERSHDGHHQTDADDHSAAETHRKHQNGHDDHHRLDQVYQKRPQRILDPLGLVENLVAGDSRREALGLQLGQTAFHLGPDLDDVAARSRRDGDAERTLPLVGHLVAHGFGVAVLHARDVAQPQLVVLVPLDDHALDLLHGAELVGDGHADAVGPVVVISGIVDVVLPVERRQRLGRTDAEHRHLFGQDRNVDALFAFAVDLDTRHTVQIAQLAFEQAGIIRQLPLRKTVARERIEHSVDQSEVVLHDDRRS